MYLRIIYDNTYIYNVCPSRTQYCSSHPICFWTTHKQEFIYIRQRVWPSPIRAGQHSCRLPRNSMRSPSHPPCVCARVRGGWRNTEAAAAGEPFSPLSTKNDWTTPTTAGGGWRSWKSAASGRWWTTSQKIFAWLIIGSLSDTRCDEGLN